MESSVIRIMVVDDHEVVRLGLASVFQQYPEFEIVGEAETVADAVSLAAQLRPDVVLLDVRLADGDGTEACRVIRRAQPEVRVLMLTSYSDDEALKESILADASGYLLKRSDPDHLVDAVRQVAAGRSLLDPEISATVIRLVRNLNRAEHGPLDVLTPAERQLLPLIAQGLTNREIAERLSLSWHTVKAHVSRMLDKLNLERRIELARFAQQDLAG
jgi:DNA-binding NarL/FixJ family response regulator